nr:MAG TPA: hypothetical protein [Caudoviricetes sp.]
MVISHGDSHLFFFCYYGIALLLPAHSSTLCGVGQDWCCSFLFAKVVTGMMDCTRSEPKGLSGKSPHLRVVFSAKTLFQSHPATLILL